MKPYALLGVLLLVILVTRIRSKANRNSDTRMISAEDAKQIQGELI